MTKVYHDHGGPSLGQAQAQQERAAALTSKEGRNLWWYVARRRHSDATEVGALLRSVKGDAAPAS